VCRGRACGAQLAGLVGRACVRVCAVCMLTPRHVLPRLPQTRTGRRRRAASVGRCGCCRSWLLLASVLMRRPSCKSSSPW
jgi:hypothetical protein